MSVNKERMDGIRIRQGNSDACVMASYAVISSYFLNSKDPQDVFRDCCHRFCGQLGLQGDDPTAMCGSYLSNPIYFQNGRLPFQLILDSHRNGWFQGGKLFDGELLCLKDKSEVEKVEHRLKSESDSLLTLAYRTNGGCHAITFVHRVGDTELTIIDTCSDGQRATTSHINPDGLSLSPDADAILWLPVALP